jgi:hypothetical protein
MQCMLLHHECLGKSQVVLNRGYLACLMSYMAMGDQSTSENQPEHGSAADWNHSN